MKTISLPGLICLVCAILVSIMASLSSINGDVHSNPSQPNVPDYTKSSNIIAPEIADSFYRIGYKPVPDVIPDNVGANGRSPLRDNLLYKKWCEETFDNGNYIYEAYKNIAFNIEYTPEPYKTDFWQTPTETIDLMKGDCEDTVLLFFSKILPNQKNAEILWGWVIDNRSSIGRAHVWYQLTDKKGQKYIVEGFSNDWNGIIPVEIVQKSETRKPILTISHGMAGRLSRLFPEVDDWQKCQTLIDLFTPTNLITNVSGERNTLQHEMIQLRLSGHEFIEYSANIGNGSLSYTHFLSYSPGHEALLYMNKQVSNILEKLHEVFSRFENQKEKTG